MNWEIEIDIFTLPSLKQSFPGGTVLKILPANAGDTWDTSSISV